MLPSMSRPANPYDNATGESFLKTLKREETCATAHCDFEDLHQRLQEFIEQYYNHYRLHSALEYRSAQKFEEDMAQVRTEGATTGAMVTFFGFWPTVDDPVKV